jgi:hypothetical protein
MLVFGIVVVAVIAAGVVGSIAYVLKEADKMLDLYPNL